MRVSQVQEQVEESNRPSAPTLRVPGLVPPSLRGLLAM